MAHEKGRIGYGECPSVFLGGEGEEFSQLRHLCKDLGMIKNISPPPRICLSLFPYFVQHQAVGGGCAPESRAHHQLAS